jgi:hypothetical protein
MRQSLTTPGILADQREHRAAERVGFRPIVVIWLPKPPDGLDVERIRRAFLESQFVEMTARDPVATHRQAIVPLCAASLHTILIRRAPPVEGLKREASVAFMFSFSALKQ